MKNLMEVAIGSEQLNQESCLMNRFYQLRNPDAPWGDYGHILMNGMSDHLGRSKEGYIRLERTGPFVPPVSFPGSGNIIVTHEFSQAIEDSSLRGFTFKPVIKAKIVHLDWHKWEQNEKHPRIYPSEGEPENYIFDLPHSPILAGKIGELLEMELNEGAQEQAVERLDGDGDIFLRKESWAGENFFCADITRYNYVDEVAMAWLSKHFRSFVAFDLIETV